MEDENNDVMAVNVDEDVNVNEPAENKHTLAIILGYVFSALGGLIGLIFSIYLQSRQNPNAVMHGRIQMCILGAWVLIYGLLVNPIIAIIGLLVIIIMVYFIIRDK